MPFARRRRWFRFTLALVLLWAGSIFATSCTVVTPDELFTLVERVGGFQTLQRFEAFWGVAWFAVVKGWHVTEFAILTTLLIISINVWRPSRRWQNVLGAAVLAVLFAASDELHQTYVPGRGGAISDVLIDSLGIGTAIAIYIAKTKNADPLAPPQP